MAQTGWPPATIHGANGKAPFVLVCEHASAFMPQFYGSLGLDDATLGSHAAWDIGALDVALRLCARLDAPLVAGAISRLVYDCNRPLEAPDCIPVRGEFDPIPGNTGLTEAQRQARFDEIHTPFHHALARVIDAKAAEGVRPVLVTVHSFTPVYRGRTRELDLGYLFHSRGEIARAAVRIEAERGVMHAAVNEPYSAADGVTYTLQKHAEARGLQAVMIEIRNDLVDTLEAARSMAGHLMETLVRAVEIAGQSAEVRA